MSPDGNPYGPDYAHRKTNGRASPGGTSLKDELLARMTPGTPDEFEDSLKPDPHVFMRRDEGLFPVNEATVMAGLQREGKTLALVGLATALRVGVSVGGLAPALPGLGTLFPTAEDTRAQMLRKIAACAHATELRNGKAAADAVRAGLIPLDLNDEVFSRTRALVETKNRQPQMGAIVELMCEAIEIAQPMHDVRFGTVNFETVSTFNDGDESNLTLRILADAARYVARHCGVASVLSHHLSQAAIPNIRELTFSSADIRGGTALVANVRQNIIAVNLGCDRFPHADKNVRTLLRRIVDDESPPTERGHKVVVLVPLDASKAALPPPIYLRQYLTPYGPALLPIPTPDVLAPLSWLEQVAYLRAASASTREAGQAAARDAVMREVIEAVRMLEGEGTPATANAVSKRCGHTSDWSLPHLNAAVVAHRLTSQKQAVPRCKRTVDVYSTPRDSSAREQSAEDSP